MSLFRNSRGIATWDMKSIANNKQACLGLEVNCIYGQKHKEGRVQLDFFKMKKPVETSLAISLLRQNQPRQTNKFSSAYLLRLTLPGSLFVSMKEIS